MRTAELRESLFGRDNILGLLNRRVADLKDGYRQNIALLGNEFIGKSSILQEFTKNLKDDKVLSLYLEIENIDFPDFVNKYIGTLIFNYLKTKAKAVDENLEILLESARRFIPATVEEIKKIRLHLEKGRNLEAYRELMGLPEVFIEETGIFCLVIFDEFQNLEEFGFSFIFQELGKKIMLQRNCLYVVISSQRSRAKKILAEKLSLLFGNFDLVDIFAFDVKASQDFIASKIPNIELNNDYRNFLIDFTGGYPLYLDVICEELNKLSLKNFEKVISLESLIETLIELIFEKRGFFYQHFNLILERLEMASFKRRLTPVLLSLANGQNKLKGIVSYFAKDKISVEQKISRLLELSLISKNGNFYYICDKLFSFWLREIYQKSTKSFDCETKTQTEYLKGYLRSLIDSFCQTARKNLSERVLELFYSFDNDYFQFNGHRFRLPVFREIKPLKLEKQNNAQIDCLIARNPELSWLVLLRDGLVTEEEVSFALEKMEKFDIKPEKNILIYVSDIEPNARLKALQEKVWLWNLSDLNLLMNFYHRPYFIK